MEGNRKKAMTDKPATLVFGELALRLFQAIRRGDTERKEALIQLIIAFEKEFPEECKVLKDRHS